MNQIRLVIWVVHDLKYLSQKGINMGNFQISFMEKSDIQESAEVLSISGSFSPDCGMAGKMR